MEDLYSLAIVGAGLSTLSALQAGLTSERTIVLDYQERPGGFLRPALPAPSFEDISSLLEASVLFEGLTTCFNATAVGLLPALAEDEPHTLLIRQRAGTAQIRARRVLLACGGLELTREQAQIPGPRPAGVITPIFAHQLLNRGYTPGTQIVVYGSSRYAQATALRLAEAGLAVTLVNAADEPGEMAASASSPPFTILPPARLIALAGFPRLESLTFERTGEQFTLIADTLIYGAGMRANTHWLKGSSIDLTASGSVQVDAHYATNVPGIFAMGTVVAPSLNHAGSIQMGKEVARLLSGGFL
jgi:thioredoxin reductase